LLQFRVSVEFVHRLAEGCLIARLEEQGRTTQYLRQVHPFLCDHWSAALHCFQSGYAKALWEEAVDKSQRTTIPQRQILFRDRFNANDSLCCAGTTLCLINQ
jgi:hypothetical protein